MTFQNRLALLFALLGCALLTSCSDDPLVPDSTVGAPTYHAELQSFDGNLRAVCGAGENDVYVVGDLILRHDGLEWSTVVPPLDSESTLRFALGFANGDLVVADDYRIFVRENGSWTHSAALENYMYDLTGSAVDDLHAINSEGLFHFDGTSWSPTPIEQIGQIYDMCSNESGHVWLCGRNGRIDHFDGSAWSSAYLDSTLDFVSIASTPSGRLFVASQAGNYPGQQNIYEVNGSSTSRIAENLMIDVKLRTDGETLFAAGYAGNSRFQIVSFNQGAWTLVSGSSFPFESLWAGRGELLATGYRGYVWRGSVNGGKSASVYPTRGEIASMVAIDGGIYTGGERSFLYENGTWTNLNKEYVSRIPAWTIDGRERTNIYAAGPQMIMHYDGRQWSWVNGGLDTYVNAIWVEPNGDVVAVGDGPTILEFDGTEWTKTRVPVSYAFNDVIGVGKLIVAVGTNGRVATRRNGEWYIEPTPTNSTLVALWAADENHIYAASRGDNEILFFNGEKWQAMHFTGPVLEESVDIWGTSTNNLFVLDWDGTLAHFDGRTWAAEERVFYGSMLTLCGNGREVLTAGRVGCVSYQR